MLWGRLMSNIYEDPVETEVDLLATILSVSVNIKKYARCICIQTQRTLCVTCRITMNSQAASSRATMNYSKILPLKYTTMDLINILKMIKNNKYFSGWYFFMYLKLRSLGNPCKT